MKRIQQIYMHKVLNRGKLGAGLLWAQYVRFVVVLHLEQLSENQTPVDSRRVDTTSQVSR